MDIINRSETADELNDANWQAAFTDERTKEFGDSVKALIYRGNFIMPALKGNESIRLFYNSIGKEQSVYINGKEIGLNPKKKLRQAMRLYYLHPYAFRP